MTYRFKRPHHVTPLSPMNYESNQLELNTDSSGITACHIRHPSVKITTSLPLCGEPCHAKLTCCHAGDVCSVEGKEAGPFMDFLACRCEIQRHGLEDMFNREPLLVHVTDLIGIYRLLLDLMFFFSHFCPRLAHSAHSRDVTCNQTRCRDVRVISGDLNHRPLPGQLSFPVLLVKAEGDC